MSQQPALELDYGTPGRYTGFIDTGTIGVTGRPSNGTDGHLDGLRRAVEVLELGGNDRELWHAYAGFK